MRIISNKRFHEFESGTQWSSSAKWMEQDVAVYFAFYLFFWSVDNNPGAKDVPALLKAAIAFSSMGGLAFLSGNFHPIKEKAWIMLVVERVACITSLVCAISLSPILLLFMRKKRFFGC